MDSIKYKLAYSLKDLLKTVPLDKLTVKNIVEHADVSRQTFYRNFEDKYDLVNWYFKTLVEDSFNEMKEKKSLILALEKKFSFIESEIVFFREAFKSQDYNSLVEYDYRYILNFYTDIIKQKTGKKLTEDVEFSLELYCRGSIYQTTQWIKRKDRPTTKSVALLLVNSLPDNLKDLLTTFE